jgi:hypothetical protein
MITLVATIPNLVVNAELVRAGVAGFRFFSFTPFGVPILALGIVYTTGLRAGDVLLPGGSAAYPGNPPHVSNTVPDAAAWCLSDATQQCTEIRTRG